MGGSVRCGDGFFRMRFYLSFSIPYMLLMLLLVIPLILPLLLLLYPFLLILLKWFLDLVMAARFLPSSAPAPLGTGMSKRRPRSLGGPGWGHRTRVSWSSNQ